MRILRSRHLRSATLLTFVAAAATVSCANAPDPGADYDTGGDVDSSPGDAAPPVDSAAADSTTGADTLPPPTADAGADAGTLDAGREDDAATESGPDDAATDASDATADASLDAGADAPVEAAVDAPGGGPVDGPVEAAADASTDAPAATCTPACGVQSACVAGTCAPARRVFVSSTALAANFGGYMGADAKCQSLANAANLQGTWKAWVSDATSSPSARFAQATVSYRLLDGTLVASSWTALTSGTLANSIHLNENAQPFQNGSEVWTATGVDGALYVDACTSFTDASKGNASWAAEGLADQTGSNWTNAYTQFCDRTAHIYCFEQ